MKARNSGRLDTRHALAGFAAVTLLYLAALAWIDSRSRVFDALPRLASAMPVLVALSMATYLVRYARWYWLLARSGHRTPVGTGLLAYLAGFAFTATPGKVGELVRVRYFAPLGVPAHRVVAAFVYERALDLVVVLALASLVVTNARLLALALSFVVAFLAIVAAVVLRPALLTWVVDALQRRGLLRLAQLAATLRDGLASCRTWLTWPDTIVTLVAGGIAWTIASGSFVWLIAHLGLAIPTEAAFAIFPLAMLAGAASMLPGGIGSAEAVIVALLVSFDASVGTATLAAVGIRLSSLWFAVICGLASALVLEARRPRDDTPTALDKSGLG